VVLTRERRHQPTASRCRTCTREPKRVPYGKRSRYSDRPCLTSLSGKSQDKSYPRRANTRSKPTRATRAFSSMPHADVSLNKPRPSPKIKPDQKRQPTSSSRHDRYEVDAHSKSAPEGQTGCPNKIGRKNRQRVLWVTKMLAKTLAVCKIAG
jgi:hypothetical protein